PDRAAAGPRMRTALLRAASVLTALFTLGHAVGTYSEPTGEQVPAAAVMRSVHFAMFGADRTYWQMFHGYGVLIIFAAAYMAVLDAIAGGASVSFMADFTREQAIAYWRKILADPLRVVLVAGECDGTAQLVLDMPPNQPHRADFAKMLVHRRARRRGLGRALF